MKIPQNEHPNPWLTWAGLPGLGVGRAVAEKDVGNRMDKSQHSIWSQR